MSIERAHRGTPDVHEGERLITPAPRSQGQRLARDVSAKAQLFVKAMLGTSALGAISLLGYAGTAGRLDREGYWSALLVATGLVLTA